ncbi:exosortase C-terminal domain/associated protein EpsI [Methylotenera sp.]|uniref:exosortase C-terminal domain/associated protein EpsI n=1 Tax=Methylotenera sp. TaxID=2051956 RepID=UPI0024885ABB|nr:exosortase C-terminal domain/associated protein EpsI [Methylotenera sp.]MDI1361125.1 EpsI family protein [Methylotenera sp.]
MAVEMSINASHKPNIQHWLAVLFMATCVTFAFWLTPHATWFEHIGSPQFENVVPRQFGDWVEVTDVVGSAIVDPEQQDALNNLYTQIVGRTYLHKPSGRQVMLSVAYGDNQTFSKQLHRPESCYSSQGFTIDNLHEEELKTSSFPISVRRMTASRSSTLEQVTYFIRIGDKVISGPPSALNYARMGMGLKGYIADGLLFRVSEVSDDAKLSNQLNDQFINDLLKEISPVQQAILIGPSL